MKIYNDIDIRDASSTLIDVSEHISIDTKNTLDLFKSVWGIRFCFSMSKNRIFRINNILIDGDRKLFVDTNLFKFHHFRSDTAFRFTGEETFDEFIDMTVSRILKAFSGTTADIDCWDGNLGHNAVNVDKIYFPVFSSLRELKMKLALEGKV